MLWGPRKATCLEEHLPQPGQLQWLWVPPVLGGLGLVTWGSPSQ